MGIYSTFTESGKPVRHHTRLLLLGINLEEEFRRLYNALD